jgi:hypothetical protein
MNKRIVCAANKYTITLEDGTTKDLIICGARHYDMLMHQQIKALDQSLWEKVTDEVQGFVNNKGEFLTREEAWVIASAEGQIIRRCGGDDKKLFSENLY